MEKIAKKSLLMISEYNSEEITLIRLYKNTYIDKIKMLLILSSNDIDNAKMYLEINDKFIFKDITYIENADLRFLGCNIEILKDDIKYNRLKNISLYETAKYLSKELNIKHIILDLNNIYES